MPWIKLEKDLATDPRVLKMASRLSNAHVTLASRSRLVVIGALVSLWWYADTHIREDDTLPIGADQINEIIGIENFCQLMPAEWLQILNPDCVKLVNYLEHNGTSAKKRALGQRRQKRFRKNGNADVTLVSRRRNATSVTRPRPRPREDLKRNGGLDSPSQDLTKSSSFRSVAGASGQSNLKIAVEKTVKGLAAKTRMPK